MTAISKPEINFKRASGGGWVFRAPNPWVLSGSPHDLVNDEQKNRTIDALTPLYASRMAAIAYHAFLAWCAIIVVVLAYGFGQAIPRATGLVLVASIVALPVLVWTIGLLCRARREVIPCLCSDGRD